MREIQRGNQSVPKKYARVFNRVLNSVLPIRFYANYHTNAKILGSRILENFKHIGCYVSRLDELSTSFQKFRWLFLFRIPN